MFSAVVVASLLACSSGSKYSAGANLRAAASRDAHESLEATSATGFVSIKKCGGTQFETYWLTKCVTTGAASSVKYVSVVNDTVGAQVATFNSYTDAACAGAPTSVVTTGVNCSVSPVPAGAVSVTWAFANPQTKLGTVVSYFNLSGCAEAPAYSVSKPDGSCTHPFASDSQRLPCVSTPTEFSKYRKVTCNKVSDTDECFAGSETLQLESGAVVSIKEVRIGDRVLAADAAGALKFSDVVGLPHAANDQEASFLSIHSAGTSIKVTPAHLIMAGECSAAPALMAASAVKVGQCIKTVTAMEQVLSVSAVIERGIYSVVTMEEFIVVNGVVASPFAVNHVAVHAFYNLHRLMYAFFPVLAKSAFAQSIQHAVGDIKLINLSF